MNGLIYIFCLSIAIKTVLFFIMNGDIAVNCFAKDH